MLIALWHDLVLKHGPKAPRLVIAGARYSSRSTVEHLAKARHLENHVVIAPDLSTPALAELIAGHSPADAVAR